MTHRWPIGARQVSCDRPSTAPASAAAGPPPRRGRWHARCGPARSAAGPAPPTPHAVRSNNVTDPFSISATGGRAKVRHLGEPPRATIALERSNASRENVAHDDRTPNTRAPGSNVRFSPPSRDLWLEFHGPKPPRCLPLHPPTTLSPSAAHARASSSSLATASTPRALSPSPIPTRRTPSPAPRRRPREWMVSPPAQAPHAIASTSHAASQATARGTQHAAPLPRCRGAARPKG